MRGHDQTSEQKHVTKNQFLGFITRHAREHLYEQMHNGALKLTFYVNRKLKDQESKTDRVFLLFSHDERKLGKSSCS